MILLGNFSIEPDSLPLLLQFVLLLAANLYLKTVHLYIILIAAFFFSFQQAQAQYRVQGYVLDSSRTYPLEAVSVMSTSGQGTITNSDGFYRLEVSEKDSIWFSYLGKPTVKFPVRQMPDPNQFDIALKVNIPVLAEVKIRPRNYRLDSLQNRQDYKKAFDFRRPNLESMTSIGPNGAGIDINEVIRLFQFRKNRSMTKFQERLLQQEQDKYVDHRFSKALVRRLTGLEGDELVRFMVLYRPSYEFALYTREYEFQEYIKKAFEQYKSSKAAF